MQVLQDKLDSTLRDVLAAATGKTVGLSQAPSTFDVDGKYVPPDMSQGYIVIFTSPSPMPEGTYGDPEDCRYFDYLIKSVGRSHRQCARIRSMVQGTMTNRAAGTEHGYATSIAVTGLAIISRMTISNGMIRGVVGDEIFEADDIYRLVVTSG